MSDEPDFPTVMELSPEAHARFMEALNNPKPPTPALIEIMKDHRTATIKRVATAMAARRSELINQPLARIWDDLASVAISELRKGS